MKGPHESAAHPRPARATQRRVSSGVLRPSVLRPSVLLPGILLLAALTGSNAARADEAPLAGLFAHYGCNFCHADREPMAGPSWAEIGGKYRGNPRASALIAGVVRGGKHGRGPWPMPPLPEVSDADAQRIARYVLALEP